MNKSKLKNKEKLHQSPGIDFSIGEIQGKQNKANSVAEPDKSMKNDRILPLGLQNSSSPALPLLENIIRLSCCQGWVCNSNSIINQTFGIWKIQLQTNSIQDEIPHLKTTLHSIYLAYKFTKIKWFI